jgi:predicted phosphodiesterase
MIIGIISDIHEDIKRLKEAFIILKKQKCDKIVCLGDFTGYSVPYFGYLDSRNAHKVINLLKNKCDLIIAGNHDLYSVKKLPKHRAGINYPRNWYSLDYRTKKRISKNKIHLYDHHHLSAMLTKEDEKFIRKLPEYKVKKYGDLKILFSHYAYPDLVGTKKYELQTPKDVKKHFAFMEKHGCTLGISGHEHYYGIRVFTKDRVRRVQFKRSTKLTKNMTWLFGPNVAKSYEANGVMVLDTDKMEIKAIPLKSKIHKVPKWKYL